MLAVHDLRRPGLAPVSFELAAGECLALRGPSGSGKSLLLRALADLDPNQGDIELDGQARASMPAPVWRRHVCYLPAEPGWWAETVGAHFSDWRAAVPLIEALGMPPDCDDWPMARLSTGERQRLGLARLLLLEPQVLLLDEPTSGLDETATAAVESLVRARLDAGAGAIWSTHDLDQAKRVARRGLAIDAGRVSALAL